jgi:hypothetical protein
VRGGTTRLVVATARATNATSPTDGIVYWGGGSDLTAGWVNITGNASNDQPAPDIIRWAGIDAVMLSNGKVRILATHSHDVDQSASMKVAWTDWDFTGVPTWTKPILGTNVDTTFRVGDETGQPWWFKDKNRALFIDQPAFDSVSPCLAPSNPDIQMVPGRSGVWRRNLGGTSTVWHPAVEGLAVTTSWGVLPDKDDGNNVMFADTDWTMFKSTQRMQSPNQPENVGSFVPQPGNCWALHQSPTDGRVVVGIGARDDSTQNNHGGGVWRSNDPWAVANGGWVNEMDSGTGRPWTSDANTPQVKGVAIGANASGTQVILAAVRNGEENTNQALTGLWRKVGEGSGGVWTRLSMPGYANPFATGASQLRQHFAWQPGGGSTVWLNDPISGLWHSHDYGATWAKVDDPVISPWGTIYSGHICNDPTRAGVYYAVTNGNRSWKITSGNGANPTLATLCPSASTPAAVTVHPLTGDIYVAETGQARLHRSTDGGATWTDITTASWEAMCATVKDMKISRDGIIYVAMYAGFSLTYTGAAA